MNIDYRYADTTLTPVECYKMITSTLETFYHSRKTNLLPMIIPPLSYMHICTSTIFSTKIVLIWLRNALRRISLFLFLFLLILKFPRINGWKCIVITRSAIIPSDWLDPIHWLLIHFLIILLQCISRTPHRMPIKVFMKWFAANYVRLQSIGCLKFS